MRTASSTRCSAPRSPPQSNGIRQLARRVQRHRALARRSRGRFRPVLDQPLPERLVAAARGAAPTAQRPRVAPRWCSFPARSRAAGRDAVGRARMGRHGRQPGAGRVHFMATVRAVRTLMMARQRRAGGARGVGQRARRSNWPARSTTPTRCRSELTFQHAGRQLLPQLRVARRRNRGAGLSRRWRMADSSDRRGTRVRRRRAPGRVAASRGIAGDRSADLR